MSAVIQNEYTGNNSTTTYSFTFPYLKTSDIKASLDGVATTAFTLPNATTLQFNTAPGSGVKIKIFRETSVDDLTATFYAGSAIKSEDLNDNFTQNLYKTQEVGARALNTLGGTMTGDLTMGEATKIIFEGATDDAHETTLTVADPTADRTITFPNVTGTVVTTGDTGTVATGMIAADAVTGAKIADDQINSEHYVDGSIDTQHIADAQVTTAKIADSNVTTGKINDGAVTTAKLAAGAATTVKIADAAINTNKLAADAVTNAKIADNSIDSEHYVDGSIDNAHLADNSVTLAKMADDSVGTAELVDGSVDTARLADNSVTLAKMVDNSVGTSELVDAAVTTAKIADNNITTGKVLDGAITNPKLAGDAVTTVKIANSAVNNSKIADGSVDTAKLASSAVTTAKIANDAVTTAKIVNDAITSAKIADDAVGSSELGDGVIDTVHIGAAQITAAKIANNTITSTQIAANTIGTGRIADDAITIGKIGCEQTTISDSDSHIPTSGAVVDYVAAQIAPLGGLEVIATEVAFPNTQPSSGVVISISDAGGVVVNGSGVSTTGRTVGGSTVTINGFPSSLQSKTMAADIGLMVSSTGSGQVYNYHKILAKEADVEQLSNDINDFASRYRVGSSNPTSSLDNGDLFFNTGTGKMLVYNGTNTAWEEVQSIGNFFISTLSPAFDNSTQNFTLTNAPTNVQQVLLSINGVVQKPNAGSSTPSEGFALDGSTIKLASAPASGSDYFVVVMGSTVNIGTPSNNTVSTAVLQDDSVTSAKIAASAVTATELGANAVITSKIADDAVTAAKLASNAVVNASVDASAAIAGSKISPDFGSQDLVTTGNLDLSDSSGAGNNRVKLGTGDDLQIYHNGTDGIVDNNTGNLSIQTTANLELVIQSILEIKTKGGTENCIKGITDGAVELYYDNGKKFSTQPSGATVHGSLSITDDLYLQDNLVMGDTDEIQLGDSADLKIYHSGSHGIINNITGSFQVQDAGTEKFRVSGTGTFFKDDIHLSNDNDKINLGAGNDLQLYHQGSYSRITESSGLLAIGSASVNLESANHSEHLAKFIENGGVELYHNNIKKLETVSNGVQVAGMLAGMSGNHLEFNTESAHDIRFRTNGTLRLTLNTSGHFYPYLNNTYDLGTSTNRFRNIYTNDINLSNEGSSNDVDGSWGNWTIQEGESDLFLKNNRSGKKYKFNLTEVA